jgi:hypothetical protein
MTAPAEVIASAVSLMTEHRAAIIRQAIKDAKEGNLPDDTHPHLGFGSCRDAEIYIKAYDHEKSKH